MRIISKQSCVDIPYDAFYLSVSGKNLCATLCSDSKKTFVLGSYATEERAEQLLEKVSDYSTRNVKAYVLPEQ